MMIVDGVLYPMHAAVSNQWKVHFFSAEMSQHPERRAEDEAFLVSPESVLGAPALRALHAISKRLELDYGGIDFALDEHGRILVYRSQRNDDCPLSAERRAVGLPPSTRGAHLGGDAQHAAQPRPARRMGIARVRETLTHEVPYARNEARSHQYPHRRSLKRRATSSSTSSVCATASVRLSIFSGYWLYAGEQAVIHLTDARDAARTESPKAAPAPPSTTSRLG